jgi:glutamyl-tRNA reductase
MVERASKQRKREPIFMLDLAVPRDIEPEVARMQDVFLYTVDDLSSVVAEGRELRRGAVEQAEAIIETRVENFMRWVQERRLVPTIREIQDKGQHMAQFELDHARRLLARGEPADKVLEQLAHRLSNKFMHGPLAALHHADPQQRDMLLKLLPQLFNTRQSD